MRNFMETATIKDYSIVRPDGARQILHDSKRSEASTCKFYLQVRLGKVHQLFGDKLNTIIEELNETLAA